MTPFHVGMKVVCVESDWEDERRHPSDPVVGGIYEITAMEPDREMFSGLGLWFAEAHKNGFYCSCNFRPVHENRMDELRSLLVPKPAKSKSPSEVA